MHLTWHIEDGDVLVLRDRTQAARAHVGPAQDGSGYVASVFEAGIPSSGPYKSRAEAAKWSENYAKLWLFPDATFGAYPQYVHKSSERVKKKRANGTRKN